MKTLILTFCLLPFALFGQTYLKVADKPEYLKYQAFCATLIKVEVVQHGKATVVDTKTPGVDYQLYKSLYGGYSDKLLKDTVWYAVWKPGTSTTALSFTSNQVHIIRRVFIQVQQRVASVADFYANWTTNKIVR